MLQSFIQLVAEEAARDSKGERDLMQGKFSIVKQRGPRPGPESSLQLLRAVPRLQPARKQGPKPYNHKELNPANSVNDPGSRFFPRVSRQEPV